MPRPSKYSPSYVNVQSGWSSTTPPSTRRSGPRFDRWRRNWAAAWKRSAGGYPGEAVVVSSSGINRKRYWHIDLCRSIQCRSDREYEVLFADVFRRAVVRRLPRRGVITAELSGGFDSSSIVCMARDILGESEPGTDRLQTVSYVYDESSSADETPFIEAVEKRVGRRGRHIAETQFRPLAPIGADQIGPAPSPLDIFGRRQQLLIELMREVGSTTARRAPSPPFPPTSSLRQFRPDPTLRLSRR
jgi:Asparagine synthase